MPLVKDQELFYLESGSKRSALRWVSTISTQLWNITYQLWMHRNDVLHASSRIHILSGLVHLQNSICSEFSTGLQHLPSTYSRYFSIPLPLLLKKIATCQKIWFLVIRSGREASDLSTSNDVWQTDQPFSRWIDFPLLIPPDQSLCVYLFPSHFISLYLYFHAYITHFTFH